MEKTYKVLEISKEREDKNKQKVDNMYQEVKHLQNMLEKSQYSTLETSKSVDFYQKNVKEQTEAKVKKTQQHAGFKQDYNVLFEQNRRFLMEKNELEIDLKHLKQQNEELNEKIKKDEDRKKKITDELSNIKLQFEKSKKETENIQQENLKQGDEKDRLISLQQQKENKLQQTVGSGRELNAELAKVREEYQEETQRLQELQMNRNQGTGRLAYLRKEFNMQLQKNQQIEKAVEMETLAVNSVFLLKRDHERDQGGARHQGDRAQRAAAHREGRALAEARDQGRQAAHRRAQVHQGGHAQEAAGHRGDGAQAPGAADGARPQPDLAREEVLLDVQEHRAARPAALEPQEGEGEVRAAGLAGEPEVPAVARGDQAQAQPDPVLR